MEKYESKQHRINRPAEQVYGVLSDFRNFTPMVAGKVEGWQATEDTCSFKVQGMTVRLAIIDKQPGSFIKLTGKDGSPLDFTFWIQMKEVSPYDTRFRLVLHAELNMMMKMMLGSKLKEGVEQMAQHMADAFNGIVPEGFDRSGYMASGFPLDTPPAPPADYIEIDDMNIPMPDPNKPVS